MSRKFIVLDTEGVNDGKPNSNNLGANALVYDVGLVVADRTGQVFDKFSIVNTDVFYQDSLMESAYYHEKIPQYIEGIGENWEPMSWLQIVNLMRDLVMDYGVKDVWAYNVLYDQSATNYTTSKASNGFKRFFAPYGTRYRDVWDYAGSTICATQKYVQWCVENGLVSPSGNPSTSADTVGKYLRGSLEYQERHTALSDAEDELRILLAAFKRKQKARQSKGQGWRDASAIAKELAK
mgnify:FL=1